MHGCTKIVSFGFAGITTVLVLSPALTIATPNNSITPTPVVISSPSQNNSSQSVVLAKETYSVGSFIKDAIPALLGSLLGSGGMLWFFGQIQLEKQRNQHQKELELLKDALQLERSKKERISASRFELYMRVWSSLQKVKTAGDLLWKQVSEENIFLFAKTLKETRLDINEGHLLLDKNNYDELQRILKSFESYELGKSQLRLIDVSSREQLKQWADEQQKEGISKDELRRWIINHNQENKEAYENLLEKIMQQFRQELGIEVDESTRE
jgi:hypothetical protein